ncbi:MAG: NTP transferase domain-containing protein [Candidatus Limnocylindrales bacterium]
MTVAAIVLVPDVAVAVGDADGEPAIRRVAHAAWAGGALPIVVVAADITGPLADAVADSPVTLTRPPNGVPSGIAWFVHGQKASLSAVTETTAGLLWPFRYAWVDPETVTSMVEAHGLAPDAIVRPAYGGASGFPILVPISFLDRLEKRAGLHGEDAVAALIADGAAVRVIELGDPGIVYDLATPRSDLPGYQGPAQPAAGPAPEWNAELAAHARRSGEPGL